jgi:hypothetical protein
MREKEDFSLRACLSLTILPKSFAVIDPSMSYSQIFSDYDFLGIKSFTT